MILTHNGKRFEFYCEWASRDIPSKAGFHWDKSSSCHFSGVSTYANSLSSYADAPAKEVLRKHAQRVLLSQATSAEVDIPCPDGEEYAGFQKAGILYTSRRYETLIGDEMRMGKAVQSIGLINFTPTIKSILIVCPSIAKLNWPIELAKWLCRPLSYDIADTKRIPTSDIVIINYDILFQMRSLIDARPWDMLIGDEIHKCKDEQSRRTKAFFGGIYKTKANKKKNIKSETVRLSTIQASQKKLYLSGTPFTNRPIELWPMLRSVDREGLGANWHTYIHRYCKAWQAPWGLDVTGADNLEELQEHLRSTFMIRRRREDVLDQVPARRRQLIVIPRDAASKQLDAEQEFYSRNRKVIDELVDAKDRAMRASKNFESNVDDITRAPKINNSDPDKPNYEPDYIPLPLATIRCQLAMEKLPYAITLIEEALESQKKIVVFAHHRDLIDALHLKFQGYGVKHYGGMSDTAKLEARTRFQTEPKCRIIFGSILATNEAISLAAASYALFVEQDWVPGNMDQAEARMELMSKKDSCSFDYLVFDGSIDADIMKDYMKKAGVIRQALG